MGAKMYEDDVASDTPRRRPGRPKGIPGTANRPIIYECSVCGETKTKDDLLAKKITFLKLGRNGKPVRSRTRCWICTTCVENDPDWTQPSHTGAPGMRGTKDAKS